MQHTLPANLTGHLFTAISKQDLERLTAATTRCVIGIETGGDHQITLNRKKCVNYFMPLHNITFLVLSTDDCMMLVRHPTGRAFSLALRVSVLSSAISLLIL